MFAVTKTVHLVTVITSLSFFVLRAVWMVRAAARLNAAWVRIAPHVIDTGLLASGVLLVVETGRYPLPAWLIAKLIGLLCYIALGSLALRRAPTLTLRVASLAGALVAACYVVLVALTRSVLLGVI